MALKETYQNISFNPSGSVTFSNSPKKQKTTLTIRNYSNRGIMFKMKSTHPRLFRMKPVYGIVFPQKEVEVCLVFRGCRTYRKFARER
ncbi:MSP domain-containing protein [Trichostrongylus colubriformis]|uniref:MSP domain-containing protein n=1 Tax=Trichostrongylus colubriformis TaxID=6319 RepID=A0AAN8FJ03_TRICO